MWAHNYSVLTSLHLLSVVHCQPSLGKCTLWPFLCCFSWGQWWSVQSDSCPPGNTGSQLAGRFFSQNTEGKVREDIMWQWQNYFLIRWCTVTKTWPNCALLELFLDHRWCTNRSQGSFASPLSPFSPCTMWAMLSTSGSMIPTTGKEIHMLIWLYDYNDSWFR
jgi:hypothetical protein